MTNTPKNKKKPLKRAIFTLLFLAIIVLLPGEGHASEEYVLIGTDAGNVRVYRKSDWGLETTLTGHHVHRDNNYIYTGLNREFRVYRVADWGLEYQNLGLTGIGNSRGLRNDDNYIYIATHDGTNSIRVLRKSDWGQERILSMGGGFDRLHDDDDYIYAGNQNDGLRVYRKSDWGVERTINVASFKYEWQISSDDTFLYFGHQSANAYVYRKSDWGQEKILTDGSGWIYGAFARGEYFYTGSSHGEVFVYDITNNFNLVRTIDLGAVEVHFLSVDDNYIYAGLTSGGTKVIRRSDGGIETTLFNGNSAISLYVDGEDGEEIPGLPGADFELLDVSSITDESARLRGRITSVSDPEAPYTITFYLGETPNINEMWFSQSFLKYGEEAIGIYSHKVFSLKPATQYFYTMRVNDDYAPVATFFTASTWPPPEGEWPEAPEEDHDFFSYYDEHSDVEFLAPLPVFGTIGGFMGEMFGLIAPLRNYFHGLVSSGDAFSQGETAGQIIPTIRGLLLELDPFFGGVPVSVAVVIFILLQFLMLGLKIIKAIFALIPFV